MLIIQGPEHRKKAHFYDSSVYQALHGSPHSFDAHSHLKKWYVFPLCRLKLETQRECETNQGLPVPNKVGAGAQKRSPVFLSLL